MTTRYGISVGKIAGVELPSLQVTATRFAPSPNGRLHLGHAFAAMCAHDFARANGGRFLLRIEDIDGTRSRPEHVEAIIADIQWLGFVADEPPLFQSQRIESYRAALERLQAQGLVYRCWCTRSEIAAALRHQPVRHGPDGPVYPGTCRGRSGEGRGDHCWRLDMAAAVESVGPLRWVDLAAGPQIADAGRFGDVILWRKDAPASYHLAATIDDAAQGISHIVRGMDLFAYTAIHRLLQELLGLPEPGYWHHPLLLDQNGEKLAKSRFSQPLSTLRDKGISGIECVDRLRQGQLPLGITRSNP